MYSVLRELMDRFIEFILKYTGGTTLEERLTTALKTSVFLASALLWLFLGLFMSYIIQRSQINALESGIEKINILFNLDDASGPFGGFVKLNNSLADQVGTVKHENIMLIKANMKLTDEKQFLTIRLIDSASRRRDLEKKLDVCLRNESIRILDIPFRRAEPPED